MHHDHPDMTTNPSDTALFDTVLVANRGEIAVRVIRTLKRMGIRSVAIYSDADAGALHVREADVAVRVGASPAAESYLDTEAVIEACRRSGAQAVHPGYGFLSENIEFARALKNAGIVFIGPGIDALLLMGDKIRSKNHVSAHDVPVTPGIAEPELSDEELIDAAAEIGFPVLIKPSAGGGGKGMVVVDSPDELPAALASARRTALSSFGDDTLFLERLVRAPRHIEVQILADTHGNTVHLGERECSLQRRHQKVIEEAPSPLLEHQADGERIRAEIGAAAVAAAESVNYVGAGTVEFLVSDEAPGEFFFMEMNTRLQVEHPVTEEVVRIRGGRIDLVEAQVRIAAGQPLGFTQEDVTLQGHAIEARVYAEDPARDFMPSTGTLLRVREPAGQHVRVDSCLLEGFTVSPHYDPMLAKVIAWGPDRGEALGSAGWRLGPNRRPGRADQHRIPAAAAERPRRPCGKPGHHADRAQDAGHGVPCARRRGAGACRRAGPEPHPGHGRHLAGAGFVAAGRTRAHPERARGRRGTAGAPLDARYIDIRQRTAAPSCSGTSPSSSRRWATTTLPSTGSGNALPRRSAKMPRCGSAGTAGCPACG